MVANRAAFAFHRQLVTEIYLPYLYVFNPIIFLAEFTFAVSLILGLGVRLVSALAIIFVLHLWLGEQRTPAERQADRLGVHLTRSTSKAD